jgi:hypothetical protein
MRSLSIRFPHLTASLLVLGMFAAACSSNPQQVPDILIGGDVATSDVPASDVPVSSDAPGPGGDLSSPDRAITADTSSIPDGAADLAVDGGVDKSAMCAPTFGNALTSAFGRADGTVLAVVRPQDQQCAQPNGTHLVLQLTIDGQAYRMVINVMSDRAGQDTRVQLLQMNAPLPGDPWSEGWHTGAGVALDYVSTLGVKSTDFMPYDINPLVDLLTNAITLGMPVSVYATSSGGASAHLVHRNAPNADGALVLDPTSDNPTWFLFHFVEQVF